MKTAIQHQARLLRSQGNSLSQIATRLEISKSTASRWCADILLTQNQNRKIEQRRKASFQKSLAPINASRQHEKQMDISDQKEKGEKDVSIYSDDSLLFLGLGLYWGEGYKKGSQELGFTNSDPFLLRVYISWLERCYGVSQDRFIARVTINQDYVHKADEIIDYWCKELNLHRSQFSKTSFISSSGSNKKCDDTYHGTLRLKARSGTSLRRRILASIDALQNYISPTSLNTAS